MPKPRIHVYPITNLGRALYDTIQIKPVLHLSVLCASPAFNIIYQIFSFLPFLYISLLNTNRFGLIARNHFHCRFLPGRLH